MPSSFWGDARPQNAAGSLQTFVSVLRRHLATDGERARELVVTEAEAYRFATELVALDLDRFDQLLERSAREPTGRAREALEHALDLVRGEVLEDEPYTAWALDLRGSYQGRVLGARLDAADAALAEFDFAAALAHAEAATTLDQFSERAHRSEMLALYALGRTHEALSRYRTYRKRLDDELGLEPGAETRALEAAVIRQEDVRSLLPRPIQRAHGGCRRPRRPLPRAPRRARHARAGSPARRRRQPHADPDRRGNGARQDTTARRAAGDSSKESGSDAPPARCSSGICRTCRLRPRSARHSRGSNSTLNGSLPCARSCPSSRWPRQSRTFDEIEVLEALVSLLAEHAPVVLLLDDLHCADARTVAALGYLRRRGVGLAGAIVTTSRHFGPSPGRPPHRLEADARVELEPLSPDDLVPLGIPDLHDITGGDPRLVAEALANGHAGRPSQTLTEALLAQCHAEGDWAYRVLVASSVLEQPFEPEPLADLLGVDAAELVETLERLCERRILRVDGFRFRFRYELVREVLLESISPARQRLLQQRFDQPAAATAEAR